MEVHARDVLGCARFVARRRADVFAFAVRYLLQFARVLSIVSVQFTVSRDAHVPTFHDVACLCGVVCSSVVEVPLSI